MILIKCCDISNEVRPIDVSEPWADCLLEEYFMQVRMRCNQPIVIQEVNFQIPWPIELVRKLFLDFFLGAFFNCAMSVSEKLRTPSLTQQKSIDNKLGLMLG